LAKRVGEGQIDKEKNKRIYGDKGGRKIVSQVQNIMDKKAETDKEVTATSNEEMCTLVRIALKVVRESSKNQ
jgi:hypothetical protein